MDLLKESECRYQEKLRTIVEELLTIEIDFSKLSEEQQKALSNSMLSIEPKKLKKLALNMRVKHMQYLIRYGNNRKMSADEQKLFANHILASSAKVVSKLSEEEQVKYSNILCSILEKRKYTNLTPFAYLAPLLKKFQVQVCKGASKLLASKDLEIITTGLKITENDDGTVSYEEVDVNDIIPNGKALFFATHQWVLDNLMAVITNPKHAVILHNKDASSLLRMIQWPTGLIEVDRDDAISRSNSKYDIGSGLVKKRTGLSTEAFPEATWNRSPNKYILAIYGGILEIIQRMDINIPIVPVAYHYVYDNIDGKKKIVKAYAVYGEPIYITKNDKIFPKKVNADGRLLISDGTSIIERLESQMSTLKYHVVLKDRQTVAFDPKYLIEEYKENGITLSEEKAKELCKSLVITVDGKTFSIDDPAYIELEYRKHGVIFTKEKLEELAFSRNCVIAQIKSAIVEEYADYLKATDPNFAGGNVNESETTKYTRNSQGHILPPNEVPIHREENKQLNGPNYTYHFDLTDAQKYIAGQLGAVTPEAANRNNLLGTFVEYNKNYNEEYYAKKQGLVIGIVENSLAESFEDEYLFVVLNEQGNKIYVRAQDLTVITAENFEAQGELSALNINKESHWSPVKEYLVYRVANQEKLNQPKYKEGDIVYRVDSMAPNNQEELVIVECVTDKSGITLYGVKPRSEKLQPYMYGVEGKEEPKIKYVDEAKLSTVFYESSEFKFEIGDTIYKRSTTCGVQDMKLTVKSRDIKKLKKTQKQIHIL